MAGSYFQNHNFGISAIDLSEVSNSEKYLGSAIGLKTSKSDAGYLDITRGKTYSLKQLFQMRKAQRLGGNSESIDVTFSGTVAASEQVVTIDGVDLTVTPASATAAALATAVATAVNADSTLKKTWTATASNAKVTLTSSKNSNSLFDSANYAGSGAVVATAVQTKWGANKITLALYTTDTETDSAPVKVLEMVASVDELAGNGQTEYEITLPPNVKRYVMLGIKKEASADILTGKSVFPIIPNQG